MERRCITAPSAPPAMGPYSHAVAVGNLVFISGQGPVHPDGSGILKGTFEEEARLTLENVKNLLEDCGSGMQHAVKMLVFLQDMDRFKEFNAIYAEYFPENPPARSCIQAGRLPGDMQVEIEAVALIPGA